MITMSTVLALHHEKKVKVFDSEDQPVVTGRPQGLSQDTEILWNKTYHLLADQFAEPLDPLQTLWLAGITTMLVMADRLEARILAALDRADTALPPAALLRETFRLRSQALQGLEALRRAGSSACCSEQDPIPARTTDSVVRETCGQANPRPDQCCHVLVPAVPISRIRAGQDTPTPVSATGMTSRHDPGAILSPDSPFHQGTRRDNPVSGVAVATGQWRAASTVPGRHGLGSKAPPS